MKRLEIHVALWPARKGVIRQIYNIDLMAPDHRAYVHARLEEMLDELHEEPEVA